MRAFEVIYLIEEDILVPTGLLVWNLLTLLVQTIMFVFTWPN
jgi:hypothetical protein